LNAGGLNYTVHSDCRQGSSAQHGGHENGAGCDDDLGGDEVIRYSPNTHDFHQRWAAGVVIAD